MVDSVQQTKLYDLLVKLNDARHIDAVNRMITYCNNVLPLIETTFDSYTNHAIQHSINLMEYMYQLCSAPEDLNPLDLSMMINACLLHDIGMIVTQDEKDKIMSNPDTEFYGKKFRVVFERTNKNKEEAIREIIRPVHALRSRNFIENNEEIIKILDNQNYRSCLGEICESHCFNFGEIENSDILSSPLTIDEYETCPAFISIMLRLSDALDISASRSPYYVSNMLNLCSKSKFEWKKNCAIENFNKIEQPTNENDLKIIYFNGKTNDPDVDRDINHYIEFLENEVIYASNYLKNYNEKYNLLISPNVRNNIKREGFTSTNLELRLDYESIAQVLMGNKIYGDNKHGLREIIQNSIDACRTMSEIAKTLDIFIYDTYKPTIKIIVDELRGIFVVQDNGIGMDLDVIKNHFLRAGNSFYKTNDYLDHGYAFKPIGRFGIGFLSCFMLSSEVTVNTKHYSGNSCYNVELKRNTRNVTLSQQLQNVNTVTGTSLRFPLNEILKIFRDKEDIKHYVEKTFMKDSFDVSFEMRHVSKTGEIEKIDFEFSTLNNGEEDILFSNDDLGFEAALNFSAGKPAYIESFSDLQKYIACSIRILRNNGRYLEGRNYTFVDEKYEEIEDFGKFQDFCHNGLLNFDFITFPKKKARTYGEVDSSFFSEKMFVILYSNPSYHDKKTFFDTNSNEESRYNSLLKKFGVTSDLIYVASYSFAAFKHKCNKVSLDYTEHFGFLLNDLNVYLGGILLSDGDDISYKVPREIRLQSGNFNLSPKRFEPLVSRNGLVSESKDYLSYLLSAVMLHEYAKNKEIDYYKDAEIKDILKTIGYKDPENEKVKN